MHRDTHKNDKEKNIKKQFNYMFIFFGFFTYMLTFLLLPDCERLIFFLMLVFDVFFLFASVTNTILLQLLIPKTLSVHCISIHGTRTT